MLSNYLITHKKQKKSGSKAWIIAVLMILSDCSALFGSGIYRIKYFGIALFIVAVIWGYAWEPIKQVSFAFATAALALLLIEVPFQSGNFSKLLAVGLYLLVYFTALWSGRLIDSEDDLYRCALVCTIFVGVLLIWSAPMIRTQLSFRTTFSLRMRVKGCFSNENSLGNIAAILYMLSLAANRAMDDLRRKRLMLCCCVLNVGYCLISGSRTGMSVMLAFSIFCAYYGIRTSISSRWTKVLLALFVSFGAVLMTWMLTPVALDLLEASGRVIRISSYGNDWFGIGYASSVNAAAITTVAGGNTEMLFVSLYYRLGYIGYLAYLLLLAAACMTRTKRDWMMYAVVVALFCQAIGESYITSVMSFVSFFDWVVLAGLRSQYSEKPALRD